MSPTVSLHERRLRSRVRPLEEWCTIPTRHEMAPEPLPPHVTMEIGDNEVSVVKRG